MKTMRCIASVVLFTSAALFCLSGRAEAQVVSRPVPTGPADVTTDPADLEAFRADLTAYFQGMKAVADAAGLPSALRAALSDLPSLTTSDLTLLQAAFANRPGWKAHPRTLKALLRNRRAYLTQVTANDCAAARSWGYTQTDIEIAADVALSADVVLEAVPQDLLSAGVRAAAVAVWAVPQGVLRGFEHLYNIAQACDAADFESGVNSRLALILGDLATLKDGVVEINHRLLSVQAVQKQIIRLELTPEGRRAVDPDVLTCTGDDCPNVLACPGDECSFPVK